MNDAPRALKAFQQAVDLNVPNYDLLAKTYNQMGTLFMYQGLHDEVIRVNRKAIELYILQGKRNKISYFQRDIARMYDAKNMPDSAMHYYKEACHTALESGDSARYYGIWGYIQKALNLKDSIDQMTKTETVAKINALYNYQRIEAENTRLKLSQETYKNWMLTLSFTILFILSSIVCLNLNQKRKKEHKLRMSEFKKTELYKEIMPSLLNRFRQDNIICMSTREVIYLLNKT